MVEETAARNEPKIRLDLIKKGSRNVRAAVKSEIRKAKKRWRKDMERNPDAHKAHYADVAADTASRSIGILSLSRRPDILRIWTEYTGDGRGFAIGLDSSSEFFSQRFNDRPQCGTPHEVIYSDERISLKMDAIELELPFLLTKTKAWEYEQETRIIRELENADLRKEEVALFNVPEEAVKEILLGWNAEPDLEEAARAFVEKHPGVVLRRARRVGSDGVEFDDVVIG